MTDTATDKKALREHHLMLRDHLEADDKAHRDERICSSVMEEIRRRKPETILTYVSFRSEADTYGIIEECLRLGLRVAVPRVEKPDIRFYLIESTDDLTDGYMGIKEPGICCTPVFDDPKDHAKEEARSLMLVPGSVFDATRDRIGYGGGFYDRFMNAYPEIYSIGLAYSCQMTDRVPVDEWDRPVDMVITDEETYV